MFPARFSTGRGYPVETAGGILLGVRPEIPISRPVSSDSALSLAAGAGYFRFRRILGAEPGRGIRELAMSKSSASASGVVYVVTAWNEKTNNDTVLVFADKDRAEKAWANSAAKIPNAYTAEWFGGR